MKKKPAKDKRIIPNSRKARGLRMIHITITEELYRKIREASGDPGKPGPGATLSSWCSDALSQAAESVISTMGKGKVT